MDKKLIEDFDRKQKSLKHKKSKNATQSSNTHDKKPKLDDLASIQPSSSYRDRAQERREGLNVDFELDPDDIRIANPDYDTTHIDGNDQEIDEAQRRRHQIEESKYLGGDIEHTHLVKGLDFALLEKVKSDQRLAEKLEEDKDKFDTIFGDAGSDSEEEEFRNEALLAASTTLNSKRQLVDLEKLRKGSTDIVQCRYDRSRRILNVLSEKYPNRSELFLPGRMSYIISLDDDDESLAKVTTILRSKVDSSRQDEESVQTDSDLALDQLVNILSDILKRGKQKSSTVKKANKSWEDDAMDEYGY